MTPPTSNSTNPNSSIPPLPHNVKVRQVTPLSSNTKALLEENKRSEVRHRVHQNFILYKDFVFDGSSSKV